MKIGLHQSKDNDRDDGESVYCNGDDDHLFYMDGGNHFPNLMSVLDLIKKEDVALLEYFWDLTSVLISIISMHKNSKILLTKVIQHQRQRRIGRKIY